MYQAPRWWTYPGRVVRGVVRWNGACIAKGMRVGTAALIVGLGLASACTQPEWDKEDEPEQVIIIEETRREPPPEGEQQSAPLEPDETPIEAPERVQTPEGDTRIGSQIEADVLFRLSFDPDVGDDLIQVEYDSGRVRLIGQVDSEEEIGIAHRIAATSPGVIEVDVTELLVTSQDQR